METNLASFLKSHPDLRAVSYCRVSSQEQKEGFSLEMQSRAIERFARENGITVIRQFGEAASASKSNRLQFGLMLKFLADNEAINPTRPIIVLVEKSDRFGRNIFDFIEFLKAGYKAVEVKAGAMISLEQSSRETKRMFTDAIDSQTYSHNLSEEVRKGQLGKAQEGYYPFGGRKFGYLPAKDELGKATMVPDPERAALTAKLFGDFATDEFSVKTIAKKYCDLGLTIKSSGKPLTPQQIHKMLRDKSFAGYFVCDGKEFKATKYQPLISLGLWEKVQAVLDNRSKSKKRTVSKLEFTYSRFFTCLECGCLMCGEMKKGGRYHYWHCANGRGKHSRQQNIPQEWIDKAVDEVVKRIRFSPEMIQLMQASYEKKFVLNGQDKARSIDSIEHQVRITKTHLDNLLEKLLSGVISDEIYRQKEQDLKGRLATLTLSLKTQRSLSLGDAGKADRLCQIVRSLPSLYPKQTNVVKRRFLKLLINKANIGPNVINIEFKMPFDRLIAPTMQVLFKQAA